MARKYSRARETSRLNAYGTAQISSSGFVEVQLHKDAASAPFFDASGNVQDDFTIVSMQFTGFVASDLNSDPGVSFPITSYGVAVTPPQADGVLKQPYLKGQGAVPYHLHGLFRPWGVEPGTGGKLHRLGIAESYTRKAKAVRRGEQLRLVVGVLAAETEKLAGDLNWFLTMIAVK